MTITVSASQVDTFLHSLRCYWWAYIRKIQLASPNEYLMWGSAVHKGLEHLYQGSSLEECMAAVEEAGYVDDLERLAMLGGWRSPDLLLGVLEAYRDGPYKSILKKFKVLDTEQAVSVPLSDDAFWRGRLDLVLEDKESGKISIMDFKTSGKKVDSSYYSDNFSNDLQMTSYHWMGQQTYDDQFDGVLIGAMQTSKRIMFKSAEFPAVRDNWQILEFLMTMDTLVPQIAHALDVGPKLLEDGYTTSNIEVVREFPFCYGYSENFCDYNHLNWCAPELREPTIEALYQPKEYR